MSESSVFTPTHTIPPEGLPVWDAPDPTRAPVTTVGANLDVEVTEQRADGWAHARFSNGWAAWLDGRRLRPVPFTPTHQVPPAGLPAWEEPDPTTVPKARLAGGLGVVVKEQRPDGWAHVATESRWSGWVDGRLLSDASTAAATTTTTAGVPARTGRWLAGAGPFALAGAALAILGGFLPWLSAGGESANAWDVPIVVLVDHDSTSDGLKVGPVLLVVALIGLPYLLQRPAPRYLGVVLGAIASNLAGLAVVYALTFDPALDLGVGLFLTFLGGAAMVFDRKLTARTIRA